MPISATSIFGGGTATTLFAVGVSAGATPEQQAAKVAVDSAERQINQIRGYKLTLTPADNKRLAEIREKIQNIDRRATEGTVRADEIEDRAELFREADTILGKPSAEVELDDTLTELREQIDELLAPKLDRLSLNRLTTLEKLKLDLEEQIGAGTGGTIARQRLQGIQSQINEITTPRNIQELSPTERTTYDELVEKVNTHANAKLVLNARESVRVYNLQKTIDELKSALPPDPSSQPTASAVARAYARIG